MAESLPYIFTSERLGFREWADSDLAGMSDISGDKKVMKHFPKVQSRAHTAKFIKRMQSEYDQNKYCFFAVEKLESQEFIGFIGFTDIKYEADFAPSVEIGWRLSVKYWGSGFATEGAMRCLKYGFEQLNLAKVYSVASVVNIASENVMKKIGMLKLKNFNHPLLADYPHLENCLLYVKHNPNQG